MDEWRVVIRSQNEKGKIDVFMDTCDTLINVSRMMIAFRPKRGYVPYSYEVTIQNKLF